MAIRYELATVDDLAVARDGIAVYTTRAALNADLSPEDGELARVTRDGANNGLYVKEGAPDTGSWEPYDYDRVAIVEGRIREVERNTLDLVPGKNLIDREAIRRGFYYSPATGAVIPSTSYRCSDFIPVEAGATYTVSGVAAAIGGFFSTDADTAAVGGFSTATFTVPAGAQYVVVNITNAGQDDLTYDATAQLERGSVATAYEPYRRVLPASDIGGLGEAIEDTGLLDGLVERDAILVADSFNKINPAACDYERRYSIATLNFVTDTGGIAASNYAPVEEGEWYTISGTALFGTVSTAQGGYFTSAGAPTAVSNITFVAPVSGDGAAFQVPTGQGITHVVINLWKAGRVPGATSLDGVVQLEKGEMATAYRPYQLVETIRPSLIPEGGGGGGGGDPVEFNAEAWYRYTAGDEGQYLADKLPRFRRDWIKRDRDLMVVGTGTSLTARTVEHCTDHPQAVFRPPLMHSNNFASLVWDRLAWDGQQYRRYDAPGFFTESGGGFATSHNLPEWDDAAYRHGLTRYSDTTGAGVQFTVPVGAWQFNFIYRTDSLGVTSAQVSIAQGAGQMQVWDDTAEAWVEAHGYTFSMRESAPVARSIQVPRATDGVMVARTIPSKSNTTYQKRLKMRCRGGAIDSRTTAKTVTITGQGTGRFMYWGVEWSDREYMITYVNAARGSFNTQADTERGLPKVADNEVWSFRPDLLFFELPIHNDGAGGANAYPGGYWERLTDHYVFRDDYELSMRTRAAYFGLDPEIAMFTASIAYNFGGINEDGSLKLGQQANGRMMSALDKFSEAYLWVREEHPEAVVINAAKRWVDAGFAIFGDLRTATEGSGKAGRTFTNEGSHWNDTGSKIMAKVVLPLFEFTL